MGLSKLSKKCRECKYVDICNHKRIEALAYFNETSIDAGVNTTSPIIQPHDYKDTKININTTATINLERKLEQSIYQRLLSMVGGS